MWSHAELHVKAAGMGFGVCLRVIRGPYSRHAVPAGPLSISHVWLSLGSEALDCARTLVSWKAAAGGREAAVVRAHISHQHRLPRPLGKEVETWGCLGPLAQRPLGFWLCLPRSFQEVPLAKLLREKGPALCYVAL